MLWQPHSPAQSPDEHATVAAKASRAAFAWALVWALGGRVHPEADRRKLERAIRLAMRDEVKHTDLQAC